MTSAANAQRISTSRGSRPGLPLLGQGATFALIGVVSTAGYVVTYAAAREFVPAATANFIALGLTAVGNTAANRRLTFGVGGRASLVRDHLAGLGAFVIALAVTNGAIAALAVAAPTAPRVVEIAVLIAANAGATLARFLLLRRFLFLRRTP